MFPAFKEVKPSDIYGLLVSFSCVEGASGKWLGLMGRDGFRNNLRTQRFCGLMVKVYIYVNLKNINKSIKGK